MNSQGSNKAGEERVPFLFDICLSRNVLHLFTYLVGHYASSCTVTDHNRRFEAEV